jgi:hypothetical protein
MKILSVELSDQECYDILTNGIETNAIQYWACDYGWINIWRDKELNILKAVIKADDAKGIKHRYTITPATIRKGVKYCLNHGQISIDDPTDPDFDSVDCDCIIQAGLFGQIIYG